MADMEDPDFLAYNLVIDPVRIPHERQCADAGLIGLRRNQAINGKSASQAMRRRIAVITIAAALGFRSTSYDRISARSARARIV